LQKEQTNLASAVLFRAKGLAPSEINISQTSMQPPYSAYDIRAYDSTDNPLAPQILAGDA
jgi:hypothetical protein